MRADDGIRNGTVPADHRPEFALLGDAELERAPDMECVIAGLFPRGGLAFTIGKPGACKSFLGLDLARSTAAGIDCCLGLATVQGPAVYVAAEGGRSAFAKRTRAWSIGRYAGRRVAAFHALTHGLQMLDLDSVGRFADAIRQAVGPRVEMITIDTLSRNAPGSRENDPGDMGSFVEACDYLRLEFGACLNVLHHVTRQDASFRGHGRLDDAADTILAVTRGKDGIVSVQVSKQRDLDGLSPFQLRLERVADTGSCVLVSAAAPERGPASVADRIRPRACLDVLRVKGPARYALWLERSGLPATTFDSYRDQLQREGLVIKIGDEYSAADDGAASR
jgi:AAA domain-containing protein